MGIQDLYQIIPEDQLIIYRFDELTGLKIAVDISIFLYKTIRSCGNDGWMSAFILLLCTLKKYRIKAVCIFDGPNPPPEKKGEQDRRRSQNSKSMDRLSECKELKPVLETYLTNTELLPEEIRNKAETLIKGKSKKPDYTNYFRVEDIISSLDHVIWKLENQTIPITNRHKDLAKEIVEIMGLTCIQADGEAEALCASLAVHGVVDAVLTEDTDVLVYGTPLMFAFKDFKLSDKSLFGLHLGSILESLGMSHSTFRDLCIMLGCDYNSRVKGFPQDERERKKPISIGKVHALAFMEEYGCIENILEFIPDPSPLIYERCREIFQPQDVSQFKIVYASQPNYEALREFFAMHEVKLSLKYIRECHEYEKPDYDENSVEISDDDEVVISDEEN